MAWIVLVGPVAIAVGAGWTIARVGALDRRVARLRHLAHDLTTRSATIDVSNRRPVEPQ